MNEQLKKQWVEALRSGEFSQTTGRLRDNEGYCCLGVLCALVADQTGDWDDTYYTSNGQEYYPSGKVLELAEIPWADPDLAGSVYGMTISEVLEQPELIPFWLANANDNDTTFEGMADLIEKHL